MRTHRVLESVKRKTWLPPASVPLQLLSHESASQAAPRRKTLRKTRRRSILHIHALGAARGDKRGRRGGGGSRDHMTLPHVTLFTVGRARARALPPSLTSLCLSFTRRSSRRDDGPAAAVLAGRCCTWCAPPHHRRACAACVLSRTKGLSRGADELLREVWRRQRRILCRWSLSSGALNGAASRRSRSTSREPERRRSAAAAARPRHSRLLSTIGECVRVYWSMCAGV